ncbi:MAG: maleylpyruvate isomerase family mycothiol-dependent enzyme [Ilumatobacteraceae bacterium]
MDRDDYLAALRRDADGFGDACAVGDLAAPVPSCPEWSLADLLWHLTEVFDFWGSVAAGPLLDPAGHTDPTRPPDGELMSTFRSGVTGLLATLTQIDPATPVWTWSTDKTAGFIIRRMAQETAMHRWDAEAAAGRSSTIEPELATDAIDEFLFLFAGYPYAEGKGPQPIGGSVHLHCTDVPGEWFVVDGAHGSMVTTRQHTKGDCAIRGPAADLLLALWRRVPLSTVEVIGDAELAARFIAHTAAD